MESIIFLRKFKNTVYDVISETMLLLIEDLQHRSVMKEVDSSNLHIGNFKTETLVEIFDKFLSSVGCYQFNTVIEHMFFLVGICERKFLAKKDNSQKDKICNCKLTIAQTHCKSIDYRDSNNDEKSSP